MQWKCFEDDPKTKPRNSSTTCKSGFTAAACSLRCPRICKCYRHLASLKSGRMREEAGEPRRRRSETCKLHTEWLHHLAVEATTFIWWRCCPLHHPVAWSSRHVKTKVFRHNNRTLEEPKGSSCEFKRADGKKQRWKLFSFHDSFIAVTT